MTKIPYSLPFGAEVSADLSAQTLRQAESRQGRLFAKGRGFKSPPLEKGA